MNKITLLLALVFCSLATSAICAHDFSVQNDTDVDLEIRLFHFEHTAKVWSPGVIKKGTTSQVVDLAHGTRILVAKDKTSGKIVFSEPIKAEDKDMKVLLLGNSPDIGHDIAFSP